MPTTHIIENPYGRIFAHGLTAGNVMLLIVDHTGKNLSIPLSADEATALGRWLFFNHQDGTSIIVEPKHHEDDDDDLWQVTPDGAAVADQAVAYARPPIAALPPAGEARWREVARLFMSSEADGYKSTETGHKGRTGYVADTLGITSKQAGNLITRAREFGAIPDSFSARPGVAGKRDTGVPVVWTDERLKELADLYVTDEAAEYDAGDGRRGRIHFAADRLGVTYNSVNRAIQKARRRGFVTEKFQGRPATSRGPGKKKKKKGANRTSTEWNARNLGLVVSMFTDPTSAQYIAKDGVHFGRTARIADYFNISSGAATMAIKKARDGGLFPQPPQEDLFALANGSLEPASA